MDIKIELSKVTDDGMEYAVSVPAPRIVDTSNWPQLTVEWMGARMQGKWLTQNSFQIGDKVFFRLRDESYDQAVVVSLADLLKGASDVEPR